MRNDRDGNTALDFGEMRSCIYIVSECISKPPGEAPLPKEPCNSGQGQTRPGSPVRFSKELANRAKAKQIWAPRRHYHMSPQLGSRPNTSGLPSAII